MLSGLVLASVLAVPQIPVIELNPGFLLLADDWARPRTGERVASMPPVRQVVGLWLSAQERLLVIEHPGGESGLLWGVEVRDWLVALGIPAESIVLQAQGVRDDAVRLRVEPRP